VKLVCYFRWLGRLFLLCYLLCFEHVIAQERISKERSAQDKSCNIPSKILKEVIQIRSLKFNKKVPCIFQDQQQVRDYILHVIDKQLPEERIRNEELAYKTIGLIPHDYDYKKGIIELYTSQIGGYYDPEKDRYVMASWLPSFMQDSVAAHELTHALQDQYHDLEEFIDSSIENSDEILARSAVLEGDAMAVMEDYERRLNREKTLIYSDNIDSDLLSISLNGMFSSDKSPKSLQMMLLFPYTSGFRFVHTALRKGGYKEVDKILNKLPKSTAEILHPELYFSNQNFYTFSEQELRADYIMANFTRVYQDTIGEFGLSALFTNLIGVRSEISRLTSNWFGDKLILFKREDSKEHFLVWKIKVKSEVGAKELYNFYLAALDTRYPGMGKTGMGAWFNSAPNLRVRLRYANDLLEYSAEIKAK
jgi:hypothetical protein